MRRVSFVAVVCALSLVVAGASGARHDDRPSGGPLGRILRAIGEVGADLQLGFQNVMDQLTDLGEVQFQVLEGQGPIQDNQQDVLQEIQSLNALLTTVVLSQPDLLIVPVDGKMCRFEGDVLIVRVKNVGGVFGSVASVAVLHLIRTFPYFGQPVPALSVQQFYDVSFPNVLPSFGIPCDASSCEITVTLDLDDEIVESDETNNFYEDIPCT